VPPEIVILRGPEALVESWRRQLAVVYAPHRLVLAIPAGAPGLPAALASKTPRSDGVAYVCRGSVCSEPLGDFGALARELAAREGS